MYNAIIKTNLDHYNCGCFVPLPVIPRIGETVSVLDSFVKVFQQRGLPTQLKVVSVVYHPTFAAVEVWYREYDIEWAKLNNNVERLYNQA